MRRVRVPRQGITNLRDKGHRVVEIGRIERERKRWGHEGEEKRRKERMHSLKPPCKYLLVERVASRKNSLYLPLSLSLSLPLVSSFSTPLSLFVSLSLSPFHSQRLFAMPFLSLSRFLSTVVSKLCLPPFPSRSRRYRGLYTHLKDLLEGEESSSQLAALAVQQFFWNRQVTRNHLL